MLSTIDVYLIAVARKCFFNAIAFGLHTPTRNARTLAYFMKCRSYEHCHSAKQPIAI